MKFSWLNINLLPPWPLVRLPRTASALDCNAVDVRR